MTVRRAHPDGLAAAVAVQGPGCCAFCEEPLPPRVTKPRKVICGRHACRLAYLRAYSRDNWRRFKRYGLSVRQLVPA